MSVSESIQGETEIPAISELKATTDSKKVQLEKKIGALRQQGESLKEKISDGAAQALAEGEKAKVNKMAAADSKMVQIEKKIAYLRQHGGFISVIERLELQKAQLENKLKHVKK